MRASIGFVIVLIGAVVGLSCESGNPVSPAPPPSAATFQSVVVTGPARILPGQTGRFIATAIYSDGRREDVTDRTQWSAFDAHPGTGPTFAHEVLKFLNGSEAMAVTIGQAVVYASFDSHSSAAYNVVTFEDGTYAAWGTVTNGRNPLHASVEIISGTRTGLFVWSNFGAGFVLYGVSGPLKLRISADGFEQTTQDVIVSQTGPLPELDVQPAIAPQNVAGTWDLTIVAPSTCTNQQIQTLRTRTAAGTIVQQSTFLTFNTLNSQTLKAFGSRGRISGETVTIDFAASYEGDMFDWIEHIEGSVLALYGHLEGTVDAGTIRGLFRGTSLLYASDADYRQDSPLALCDGKDGSFLMTRRQ